MTLMKNHERLSRNLWLSMLISVVFPMLLGLILSLYISDWSWVHYPFHAMVESVGSLSALIIAAIMIVMMKNDNLPSHYIWVVCALISMGLIDGFHAVLHSGISFVWLHSIATLIGGLTFSAIWISKSWYSDKYQNTLIFSFVTFSLLISVFSISSPENLPVMIIQGEFSVLAKFLNITGGLGFLAGSAYFVYLYYKDDASTKRQQEDLVFANHSLLFGIAGLLFESSIIWDAGWWWWHILRLCAYFVVLIYFFTQFKQQQDLLTRNKLDLEQRVYERTKELEKASRAKDEFLSSMSHELRTPMNAILGFTQLMELDKQFTSKHKKYTSEILQAGNHLLELINEILDLSKIEEGKLDIDMRDTDITKIINDSISTISPLTKQNNVHIINNIAEKKQYIVDIDELRFKQVVINLLSNAIKYNVKDGKVLIDVHANETGNTIRIEFKDTGKGISKEKQEKLFVPFERLGFEASVVEGAGIGLVLCKKLLDLMNGTIGMHSINGQGSTFYIEFPYYTD